MVSVKNFQIVSPEAPDKVVLQFGKARRTDSRTHLAEGARCTRTDGRGHTRRMSLFLSQAAKEEYILDFGYPLTPLQALALGLSSLAYKLANEGG